MIELVDAAIGAAGVGAVAAIAAIRRAVTSRRDERAQVIAMRFAMGIEYVPGEDFDLFRVDVVRERDRRAAEASAQWFASEREAGRRRGAKGRFV